MGATLNGFWASEREENFEDAEDIQYSEYPFSTGLANIKDDNAPEKREDMADAGWVQLFSTILITINYICLYFKSSWYH